MIWIVKYRQNLLLRFKNLRLAIDIRHSVPLIKGSIRVFKQRRKCSEDRNGDVPGKSIDFCKIFSSLFDKNQFFLITFDKHITQV